MGTKYEVILTKKAKRDLDSIYTYIAKNLKEENAAKRLMKTIQERVLILEDMPEGFSIVRFYNKKKYEYRKLVVNNFIVIYRIDNNSKMVYIVKIAYKGKNYLNE